MADHRSTCCGAPVQVRSGGTTHWWVCSCCGQPCDAVPEAAKHIPARCHSVEEHTKAMKATIRTDGTLSVIPESELEAYALSKWWANHQQGDNSSSLEVLFNEHCIEHPSKEN